MKDLTFRNYGGIHQMVVEDDADLAAIDRLDAAHWAATSAPLLDLHCDPAFLACLDTDATGRIRVSQLLAARNWLFERLANRRRIREGVDILHLSDLNVTTDAGQKLKHAAEHVIREQHLAETGRLSLQDLRAYRANYFKTLANGDGVVPPDFITDGEVQVFIRDVMQVVGSARDASGQPGVGSDELDRFLDGAKAYLEWQGRPARNRAIRVWDDDTALAAERIAGLDAKLEDYFLRCDLLAHQGAALDPGGPEEGALRAWRSSDPGVIAAYLTESPLAPAHPEGKLVLGGPVNPAYRERLAQLRTGVLERALGSNVASLTRADWRKTRSLFDAWHAWQAERPREKFDLLPWERLAEYLAGPLPARLRFFIAEDHAAAPEVEQMAHLEKLILLQRWLLELVNNFVNFSAMYHPQQSALVEMGCLVIDGRRLEFCVKVGDRAAHRKVAADSMLFLVYASITAKDGTPPAYEVAAPVTSGERGRLRPGKRGIFVDRDGREWDATVVDIVENPISVWEAIKAPFRRTTEFVSNKIEELASASLKAAEKVPVVDAARAAAPGASPAGPTLPATGADGKPLPAPTGGLGLSTRDLLLGGGIAFAAVGSALAYVTSALAGVRLVNLLGVVVGLVVLVGGLAGLLGWLKLRRRDMSLVLEANGWAVNAHMKVTRRIGRIFTRVPPLPKGHVKVGSEHTDVAAPVGMLSQRAWVLLGSALLTAATCAGLYYYYAYVLVPQ